MPYLLLHSCGENLGLVEEVHVEVGEEVPVVVGHAQLVLLDQLVDAAREDLVLGLLVLGYRGVAEDTQHLGVRSIGAVIGWERRRQGVRKEEGEWYR